MFCCLIANFLVISFLFLTYGSAKSTRVFQLLRFPGEGTVKGLSIDVNFATEILAQAHRHVVTQSAATAKQDATLRWTRHFSVPSFRPDGQPSSVMVALGRRKTDVTFYGWPKDHPQLLVYQSKSDPIVAGNDATVMETLVAKGIEFIKDTIKISPSFTAAVVQKGQPVGVVLQSIWVCTMVKSEYIPKENTQKLFHAEQYHNVILQGTLARYVWYMPDQFRGALPAETYRMSNGYINVLESDWFLLGLDSGHPFKIDSKATIQEFLSPKGLHFEGVENRLSQLESQVLPNWTCKQSEVLSVEQIRDPCVMLGSVHPNSEQPTLTDGRLVLPSNTPELALADPLVRLHLHALGLYPIGTVVMYHWGESRRYRGGHRSVATFHKGSLCTPAGWSAALIVAEAQSELATKECKEFATKTRYGKLSLKTDFLLS